MKTFADVGINVAGKSGIEVKTTCPMCSHTRKKANYPCLNVNTIEGVWHCWHCGWADSLKGDRFSAPQLQKKVYRKSTYVAPDTGLPEKALDWFTKRGITAEVLVRNKIAFGSAYFPQVEEERPCVMFPYMREGKPANVKYRTGDKLFRMEAGCERVLYGLDDIGDTLYWVEGEIDKLSVEVAGFTSCVSVPDGAPAIDAKNYESKFDFLACPEIAKAKLHVLAMDSDAVGLKMRAELVRRLGIDKCRIVDWPTDCKDANDVLVKHDKWTLTELLSYPRELPIVGAHHLSSYAEQIDSIYKHGVPRGVSTGWKGLDSLYRVRRGDVTIVTGAPNSGKSEWLDALCMNLARRHQWGFGIYSPEQGSPAEHIAKLAEKYTGKPFNEGPTPRMSRDELYEAEQWLGAYFTWIEPEKPTLEALLEITDRLVLSRGVLGLVLDPWNEIEHARPREVSETEYIGIALRTIRRFAREHDIHIWVVAHPTKLQKDPISKQYPVATAYDISGSANWNNKADAVISIWRERDPDRRTTEVEVHVQKVRSKYAGQLGLARLNWNHVTGCYSDADERY
jgi:twinkle protein